MPPAIAVAAQITVNSVYVVPSLQEALLYSKTEEVAMIRFKWASQAVGQCEMNTTHYEWVHSKESSEMHLLQWPLSIAPSSYLSFHLLFNLYYTFQDVS